MTGRIAVGVISRALCGGERYTRKCRGQQNLDYWGIRILESLTDNRKDLGGRLQMLQGYDGTGLVFVSRRPSADLNGTFGRRKLA